MINENTSFLLVFGSIVLGHVLNSLSGRKKEKTKVCIIGAGVSGFAVASRLARSDVNVTILEARDRVGGRLHSVDMEGEALQLLTHKNDEKEIIELGAQWCHYTEMGPSRNASLRLCHESAGIALSIPESWTMKENSLVLSKTKYPSVTVEQKAQTDEWVDKVINDVVLKWELYAKSAEFIAIMKSLNINPTNALEISASELLQIALFPENIKRYFAEQEIQEGKQQQYALPSEDVMKLCFEMQENLVANYFGLDACNVSWRSLDDYSEDELVTTAAINNSDDLPDSHRVVIHGYFKILRTLAQRANLTSNHIYHHHDGPMGNNNAIKLNAEVTSICQEQDGKVHVTYVDSNTKRKYHNSGSQMTYKETFDYVVCCVPLGVLKNNNIDFHPSLPQSISHSIDVLEMGLLHKVILVWNETDWHLPWNVTAASKYRIIYPVDHRNTFSFVLNLHDRDYHHASICGFAFYSAPPFAIQAEHMNHTDLTNQALAVLQLAYKENAGSQSNETVPVHIPKPVKVMTTSWLRDPYSLGGYSAQTKRADLSDFDSFRPDQCDYGKVFFAGEHCQSDEYGCVQAALDSGYRAGEEILQRIE